MFVFKAAVVGAGTMGGQIAQTIAASGTPVVLKDVKDELVQAGLDEARNVTQGQVKGLVEKGRLTEEQAAAQVEEVVGRIHGATTYEGFGDVDFVIEAVPERMEIKQAVFAELDAVTPGPRDPRLEHLVAVDHRDRRGDQPPRQGRRLPLLLPRLDHAADRGRRGRRHLGGDGRRRGQLRPGDPQAADHVRRGARLRGQPHPQRRHLGGLARAGGEGPLDQAHRRGRRRRQRRADGPVLPGQPARPRHRAARRRAPARVLRRALLRARGDAAPRGRGQARRQDRRRRRLHAAGRARPRRATPSPTSTSSSSC